LKFVDVSEVLAAPSSSLIAVMMETASTCETPVHFYQTTRRNIPEDSNLQHNGVIHVVVFRVVAMRSLAGDYNVSEER
jgi:hypothetical protein